MQTPNKKPDFNKILMIACAVLLLAVIVLGAFAYTWKRDLNTALKKVQNLQMQTASFDSLTTELANSQMNIATLQAELDSANTKLEAANAELEELKAAEEPAPEATEAPEADEPVEGE